MRSLLFATLFSMAVGAGPAAAATLADLRWDYRVIVVFVPTDTRAAEIIDMMEDDVGIEYRDIVWFVFAPDTSVSNLDRPFNTDDFTDLRREHGLEVVLIGKDGGVKARQTEELDLSALYERIDAMPMRQREMRER